MKNGKWYAGKVVGFDSPYWRVKNRDGDEEDLTGEEIRRWKV